MKAISLFGLGKLGRLAAACLLLMATMAQAAKVEIQGKHLRADGSVYDFEIFDGDALSPGDRFQIVIGADKPTYYSVIYVSRDGQASQLFPLSGARGFLKANTRKFLPTEQNYFTLDDNGGRELMFVVTSANPISNLQSALRGVGTVGKSAQEIHRYLDTRLDVVNKLEVTNTGKKVLGLSDQVTSSLTRDIARSYQANPWPESFSQAPDSRRRTRQADDSIPEAVRQRAAEVRQMLRRPSGTPDSSSLRTVTASPKPSVATSTPLAQADSNAGLINRGGRSMTQADLREQEANKAEQLMQARAAEAERQRQAELATAEKARLEAAKVTQERKRVEAEQLAAEEAARVQEQRRIEAERAAAEEQKRLVAEQAAREQAQARARELAAQQSQEQAQLQAEAEAAERARLESERAAELARQQAEQQAAEQARLEQERLAAERAAEAQRLAEEEARLQAELAAAERAAEERRLQEQQEAARQAEEKRLAEEAAAEKAEQERIAAEEAARQAEAQRIAAEAAAREAEAVRQRQLAQTKADPQPSAVTEPQTLSAEPASQEAAEPAKEEPSGFFGKLASILGGGDDAPVDAGPQVDSTGVVINEQQPQEPDAPLEVEQQSSAPTEAVVVLQAPARPLPLKRTAPAPVRVEPVEPASSEELRQLYDQVAASIVSVSTSKAPNEAGFVLDTRGHVLTSWHAVNGVDAIDVKFIAVSGASRSYQANVIKSDKFRDLALLQLANPPEGVQPIVLASGGLPDAGTRVRVFGQKDGEVWATDDAVITRIAENFTWFSTDNVIHRGEILQIDLPSSGKGIGSLVTSMDYKLLGMRSFSGSETGRAYAVSVRNILAFVQGK